MGLDYHSRRRHWQGKFLYLLDDEEKTAWIDKGHIGRCRRYRLPDHVVIDGIRYTIESVERGAYGAPRTLHHLVIPDTFNYVDEWAFCCHNLRSVHIGKGLKYIDMWTFCHCYKSRHIHIDKDNPYLKYEHGMVLSKDGKILWVSYTKYPHVTIPEGVEEIHDCAFMENQKLESVVFPQSLRKMGDNSFGSCPNLRNIVLPEGFEECVIQSFWENEKLSSIDLPSTFTQLGIETFWSCSKLETIVLRAPIVAEHRECFTDVPTDRCRLFVPAELVEQYRKSPQWNMFQHILPLESYSTQI